MVAVHSLSLFNNILPTYGLYYISYDDSIVLCAAAIAFGFIIVVVVLDPNATAAATANSSTASTTMHCRRLVSHLHLY
jgi:hypothetical protein